MSTTTNAQKAHGLANELDLSVAAHNPGDGIKVKVFMGKDHNFHDSGHIFATNNAPGAWAKVCNFLEGYKAAVKHHGMQKFDTPHAISVHTEA